MNDTIVIGGQTDLDGHIDGEVNIKTEVAGECGIFFQIAPPPAPVEELVIKDVMFMDYDGSVVASYDAADFIANVTSLPTPPSHDGLTFQEWNWDLADIKTELQTGSGACCIGACYETTDGKTHFFIDLKPEEGSKRIQFYLQHSSGTHVIDWGDGTTNSYSANATVRHLYANWGKYEITVDGGVWKFNAANYNGIRSIPENDADVSAYNYMLHTNTFLTEVWCGTGFHIDNTSTNTFKSCPNFKKIAVNKNVISNGGQMLFSNVFRNSGILFFVFPKGTGADTSTQNSVMNNCFTGCDNIVAVSFPKGFIYLKEAFAQSGIRFLYFPRIATLDCKNTFINLQYSIRMKRVAMSFDTFTTSLAAGFSSAFRYCYGLQDVSWEKMNYTSANSYLAYSCENLRGTVTLPSSVTVLSGNCFYGASVSKFTFLGNITSIGANTFYTCYNCLEWDFTHCTAVPTLANTNAFQGIVSKAVIKVPAALESSWKTAANWSTYASYIVGV